MVNFTHKYCIIVFVVTSSLDSYFLLDLIIAIQAMIIIRAMKI